MTNSAVLLGVLLLPLLVFRVLDARTCRSDYNDVGSKTLRASLVIDGQAKSRISIADRPDVYRIEFTVNQVLKGNLSKAAKGSVVVVGDFGQPDVDKCVAPEVTLESRYLVFVESNPDDRQPKSSALPSPFSTTTSSSSSSSSPSSPSSRTEARSSGPRVYHVSSFPETWSSKAMKEVKSFACSGCGKSPSISKEPQNKTDSEGQRIRLHCRASGKPTPRITWFKDGVPLSRDKRITIKENKRDSRLQIRKAGAKDSGVYRCQATNLLGRSQSRDARVKIQASKKPHSTRCRVQNMCLNGGTCYEVSKLKKQYCECPKQFSGVRCQEKRIENTPSAVSGKGLSMYYIKRKRKRHLRQDRH